MFGKVAGRLRRRISEGVIWNERQREREGGRSEGGGREGGREDAASGKWLLQPQAYPDTPKRHQGGERRGARGEERGGRLGENERR